MADATPGPRFDAYRILDPKVDGAEVLSSAMDEISYGSGSWHPVTASAGLKVREAFRLAPDCIMRRGLASAVTYRLLDPEKDGSTVLDRETDEIQLKDGSWIPVNNSHGMRLDRIMPGPPDHRPIRRRIRAEDAKTMSFGDVPMTGPSKCDRGHILNGRSEACAICEFARHWRR